MAELLKYMYNERFVDYLTIAIHKVLPSFQKKIFKAQIFDATWDSLELKQRMRRISNTLHAHLPQSYPQSIEIIYLLIQELRASGARENSFEYMFLPDFVEQYGIQDLATSLDAIEFITQFTSCEFAIRPFILQHQTKVLARMKQWSKHDSHLVRRLSSEGCRPRLPWAMALPALKKDPSPILPILENLKSDSFEFVRKSVANNLNDIAKDNPQLVIDTARRWQGSSKESDWIIKHGSRTLLKKADAQTLVTFGLSDSVKCEVEKLTFDKSKLRIGDTLSFSFQLINLEKQPTKLRLEYVVYYRKSSGKQNKKVFKIAENMYQPGTFHITRTQSFKEFTTRKHYAGTHHLGIVLNGKELIVQEFELLN